MRYAVLIHASHMMRPHCLQVLLTPIVFNPRTPQGCDLSSRSKSKPSWILQSTRPCGARPYSNYRHTLAHLLQPTHPCGVRPTVIIIKEDIVCASTHAPSHTGCDGNKPLWSGVSGDFNPRTPQGVRRAHVMLQEQSQALQSTHPLRGAT